MPLRWLTTLKNEDIELDQIDLINDAPRFGVSPATLSYILDHQQSRKDVTEMEVSASQFGKGVRQMLLEGKIDFAMSPQSMIAGTMGTLKHSKINVGGPDTFSEIRFKTANQHISAKHDNACVVHHKDKMVDLYDLKAIGWFKVKLILTNGIWKEGKEYGMQLNLQAVLIEQNTDYKVNKMFLEFVCRDLDARKRVEAEKLGILKADVILCEVPRLSSDAVLGAYEKLYQEKVKAYAEGYAPVCPEEQRWINKKTGVSTRCSGYCPVVEACKAMCLAHNETHPSQINDDKEREKALTNI